MFKVYGMSSSGNCHKVRLALEMLRIPYEWHEIDIMKRESRTQSFLAMNPNGRVPTLEVSPGKYLPESNAILFYVAEGSRLLPSDRLAKAQVLQWMFFEQYSHEPYVAVARFILKYLPGDSPRRSELPRLYERGYQALDVMERRLAQHAFLVGDAFTIADIALFAYTNPAADAGFDMSRYPGVRAWLERVKSQPGYVEMAQPGPVSATAA